MGRHILERVLSTARRHATLMFVAAGAAAIIGVILTLRVSFDANILRLLPQDLPAVAGFRTFLEDFGSLDHLYVVFESKDAIREHTETVDAYVAALRAAPEIESVDAQIFEPGKDWNYLFDRELLLLSPATAARALGRFRPPELAVELAHSRDLLSMPSPEIKTLVQQDPLSLLGLLKDELGREKGALSFDPTQEGYVSLDGHSRLVIVKPRGEPFDTDFCRLLFRRLDDVERTVRAAAVATDPAATAVAIQAAGAYRVSLEAEHLIRSESIVNSVGSLVLLLLFVLVLFRTPWMVVYGIIPLALAALLALGAGGLIRGSLSPATSGSAGMLFGLGIDGIVLLYLRYLEEQQAGWTPADATRRMAGTAASVILAQVTTATTFFALLVIDFPSLQDLGILIGLGILFACGFTVLLLPALLARYPVARVRRAPSAPWLGRFVVSHSRRILWGSVVVTLVLGVAASRLRVDTRLEKLQARTQGTDFERDLAARFSLPQDVLLVLNDNDELEPLIDADARLRATLAVRDPAIPVSGISALLPPSPAQDALAGDLRTSGLTASEVARQLDTAGQAAGFRADTFAPFLDRLPRLLDPDQRVTYAGLIDHGLGSLVSRFVTRRGGRYVAVTYLYPQHPIDLDALDQIVRGTDSRFRVTGLPVVNRDLARRFTPEFLRGLAIGVIAVALIIYTVFRTIRHTLLALLPTIIGFVWSAGILALLRIELDLFSLFAAVTFVGIAVDYGIYVLYRHVVEQTHDMCEVLTRTGAAIMIACLSALIGFGTLIASSYGPLRLFGIVSLITLTCCALASLLVLPAAILHTTDGRGGRRGPA